MPAVVSIDSRLRAQFAILSLAPPRASQIPLGILLFDPETSRLEWKLREDLDELDIAAEDAEYVSCLDSDFHARAAEMGGPALLESLEDSLSGFLRISAREAVSGHSVPALLNRLFDEHVDARVRPFVTHLPFYGLRAAATKFGEDREVESEVEWLRAPAGLRLSGDLFVVEVLGRSMEPLIPDGSRVIFRRMGAGSRQGKRLLIEELGATDSSARFTVKRYTSVKKPVGNAPPREDADGEWAHASIRLEPLNPEFPPFSLDPEAFEGKYRVIGEFVQVLS
jgi:SOS-response transcriptional repressor LexA